MDASGHLTPFPSPSPSPPIASPWPMRPSLAPSTRSTTPPSPALVLSQPSTNPFDDPLTLALLALALLKSGEAKHAVLSVASKAVRDRGMFALDAAEDIGASGTSSDLASRMYGVEAVTDRTLALQSMLASFEDATLLSDPARVYPRYRRLDNDTLFSAVEFARQEGNVGLCVLAFEPEERRGWVWHDLVVCSSESWDVACGLKDGARDDRIWFDSEAEAEEVVKKPDVGRASEGLKTKESRTEEDLYWDSYDPLDDDETNKDEEPIKTEEGGGVKDDEASYWDSYGF